MKSTEHHRIVVKFKSTPTAEEASQSARPLLMLFVALARWRSCFCLDILMLAHPAQGARALLALLFLHTAFALFTMLFATAMLFAAGIGDLAVCAPALFLFTPQIGCAGMGSGLVFAIALPFADKADLLLTIGVPVIPCRCSVLQAVVDVVEGGR